MIETLLTLVIVLAIVGVILWGLGQIQGIPPVVKTVITVIVAVVVLVWLLQMVGGTRLNIG